jgi:hypothetical protein
VRREEVNMRHSVKLHVLMNGSRGGVHVSNSEDEGGQLLVCGLAGIGEEVGMGETAEVLAD